MDLNNECPFKQNESHKTRGGCIIYFDPNTNMFMHKYKSLNTSVAKNGQLLFEFLNENNSSQVLKINNYRYEFLLNQRLILEIPLNFLTTVHISDAIHSPQLLLNMFNVFLDNFDEIAEVAKILYGKKLYLTQNCMCDIIIDTTTNEYSFLRPTLFHDDDFEYYRSVQNLFKKMYQILIANVKKNNLYMGKMETSKRNIANCTLDQHKSGRLLHNFFKCSEYGCNHRCKPSSYKEADIEDHFEILDNDNYRAKSKDWCYGWIPPKSLEKNREKIYQFECIYEKKMPILHYELFERDEKMHRIMCCPKVLLCEGWYQKMRKWMREKLENLNEKTKLNELNKMDLFYN